MPVLMRKGDGSFSMMLGAAASSTVLLGVCRVGMEILHDLLYPKPWELWTMVNQGHAEFVNQQCC